MFVVANNLLIGLEFLELLSFEIILDSFGFKISFICIENRSITFW